MADAAAAQCANCGMVLLGPFCHGCGQHSEAHHRSLRHLAAETFESLTHADGRLWRTLRLLVRRPGKLTRDYLDGHRASEIPPLRLFLVMLLIVFASGALLQTGPAVTTLPTADRPEVSHAIDQIRLGWAPGVAAWLREHVWRAIRDPQGFIGNMREWGERFAILLLPLSALALRVLFPFRRDVGLYDHLIFTMHSLSFAALAWVMLMAVGTLPEAVSGFGTLFLLAPVVHLFVHMRGVYRTGIAGTLVRMALLGGFTGMVFLLLLAGLALLSLGLLRG